MVQKKKKIVPLNKENIYSFYKLSRALHELTTS